MTMKTKISVFTGVGTALLTPFSDGSIDFHAFRRLIERQIEGGASALIVAGTTGEASTLSEYERDRLTATAAETAAGRVPVIVGTGANDTRRATEYGRNAIREGADALLIVTPFYNKGTVAGVTKHFLHLAEASPRPILLYNVPSRTGVDLTMEQYASFAEHPNIAGVKEAKSDIEKLAEVCVLFSDKLSVYTGNDQQLLPSLAFGAEGVISVTSNLFPREYSDMVTDFTEGRVTAAGATAKRLFMLTKLLFRETNPAPLKAAMACLGLSSEEVRLPLAEVEEGTKTAIREELFKLGALL